MNAEEKERFSDQVWVTRISRVNAEKRLLNNERIAQGANIYYSIIALIASISLLSRENHRASFFIVGLTIALTIISLYYKSQNLTARAMSFREIYTDLQKIEFQLKDPNISNPKLMTLYNDYCDLLKKGENHISFDYYKTIVYSNKSYRDKHLTGKIQWFYYLFVIFRIIIVALIFLVPVIILIVLMT